MTVVGEQKTGQKTGQVALSCQSRQEQVRISFGLWVSACNVMTFILQFANRRFISSTLLINKAFYFSGMDSFLKTFTITLAMVSLASAVLFLIIYFRNHGRSVATALRLTSLLPPLPLTLYSIFIYGKNGMWSLFN